MSPSAFCDQAVDEPAIGIEATRASPTRMFCTSSGLCQSCIHHDTDRMKTIGKSILAEQAGGQRPRPAQEPAELEVFTPSPALKSRQASIISGKDASVWIGPRPTWPSDSLRIARPGPRPEGGRGIRGEQQRQEMPVQPAGQPCHRASSVIHDSVLEFSSSIDPRRNRDAEPEPHAPRSVLGRDEDAVLRQLGDDRIGDLEVVGQDGVGVGRQPGRQADLLVVAAVEADQDAQRLVADVLDVVAVAAGDVAGVALLELLGPGTALGAEDGHAGPAA